MLVVGRDFAILALPVLSWIRESGGCLFWNLASGMKWKISGVLAVLVMEFDGKKLRWEKTAQTKAARVLHMSIPRLGSRSISWIHSQQTYNRFQALFSFKKSSKWAIFRSFALKEIKSERTMSHATAFIEVDLRRYQRGPQVRCCNADQAWGTGCRFQGLLKRNETFVCKLRKKDD